MRIVIVGAGFSGTVTAIQLIRSPKRDPGLPLAIKLVEKNGQFGPGVAYGTTDPNHLLNVPLERMSAFPSEPEHFINWYRRVCDPTVQTGQFIPRFRYGQYLQHLLNEIQAKIVSPVTLERISDEAVEAVPKKGGAVEVRLKSGRILIGDQLILALGNSQPSRSAFITDDIEASPHYLPNAWTADRIKAIDRAASVAIFGTGLSMVDATVVLSRQGHRGRIFAISRRGQLPQPHRTFEKYPSFLLPERSHERLEGPAFLSVRLLAKKLRKEIQFAQIRGTDWRSVFDSLRPLSPTLWSRLSLKEKQRFLRHLQSYWDTHRHRMAPEIGEVIQDLRKTEQLKVCAGRIQKIVTTSNGFEIQFRPRGTTSDETIRATTLINCLGPDGNYRKSSDSFIRSLLNNRLVGLDPMNMGFDRIAENVHFLGALRKGSLWETVAVPELRFQSEEVATKVLCDSVHAAPQEKQEDEFWN